MLVFKEKGKSMDVSLNPQFLADLGMLVQIVFPKPTQSFVGKDEIICVLESNRKLMSIRNPWEGVFRAFNGLCEALPEKYTADQTLFSVQPMTIDDYKKEQAEKAAKVVKKKPPPSANIGAILDEIIVDNHNAPRMAMDDLAMIDYAPRGNRNLEDNLRRLRQMEAQFRAGQVQAVPQFRVQDNVVVEQPERR